MTTSGGKPYFPITNPSSILTLTDHTFGKTLMPMFVCLRNVMTKTNCLVIAKNGYDICETMHYVGPVTQNHTAL